MLVIHTNLRTFSQNLRTLGGYSSKVEERLSIYLEYHPHVRTYQRGDASKAFAEAYHLTTPLGTPYPIKYVYDGTKHEYLPDYVGTLVDGKLLIAEAGLEDEKSKGKPLAKAEAARGDAQEKGGVYRIGTEKNLPLSLYHNLLYLHNRREAFKTFHEIAPVLLANWPWGHFRTVKEFVKLLGGRWPGEEIEATVWKIVGDAAAEGRLLVDLTEVEISLSTQLALLDPGALLPFCRTRSRHLWKRTSRVRANSPPRLITTAMRLSK